MTEDAAQYTPLDADGRSRWRWTAAGHWPRPARPTWCGGTRASVTREGRGVWMKSSGWGFEEIDAGRVVLVSPDGEVLAGTGPRHIEYPIHTEIMAARPGRRRGGAHALAGGLPVRRARRAAAPARPRGSLFCYPVHPPLRADRRPDQGPVAWPRRWRTRSATAIAILLPQHGIVTVGPDLPAAVMAAVLLDRACRTQLTARWRRDRCAPGAPRTTPWPSVPTSGRPGSCGRATSTCSARPRRRPQHPAGPAAEGTGHPAAEPLGCLTGRALLRLLRLLRLLCLLRLLRAALPMSLASWSLIRRAEPVMNCPGLRRY